VRTAEQSRRCAGPLSNRVLCPRPPSRTARPLNAARAQDPIYQPGVALFIAELKQAYPELFHAFYIGNLVGKGGWLPWQATPMRAIAPVVDLVIVSVSCHDTAAIRVAFF